MRRFRVEKGNNASTPVSYEKVHDMAHVTNAQEKTIDNYLRINCKDRNLGCEQGNTHEK